MTPFTKKLWIFNLIFSIGTICLYGFLLNLSHSCQDGCFGMIGPVMFFLSVFILNLTSIYIGIVLTANPWLKKNNIVGFRRYLYVIILGPIIYSFAMFQISMFLNRIINDFFL